MKHRFCRLSIVFMALSLFCTIHTVPEQSCGADEIIAEMDQAAREIDAGQVRIPSFDLDLDGVRAQQQPKVWTILIYMAADNDLYPFASQNLAQMKEIGSNKYLNIVVQLDTHLPGKSKVTKRLFVEKNHIVQVGSDMVLDSGSEQTFADAALWAMREFPSDHFAIVLWNHGSGDLNPRLIKTINPAYLFKYNPSTERIELDRSIGFMDFVDMLSDLNGPTASEEACQRGICFDETNKTYLDDQKLMRALKRIIEARNGKRIDLVIFDACLMAGTGTAWIMSQFANYMVASEEVVLGPGYNYKTLLTPLAQGANDAGPIAAYIVNEYARTYGAITNDYTQSAFNLAHFKAMAENIDQVARLLINAMSKQTNGSVTRAIRLSRAPSTCTFFDEPSYIDLGHFYKNLLKNLSLITLDTPQATTAAQKSLKKVLEDGLANLAQLVIVNACGANLRYASGLSIYFPERRIMNVHHNSYKDTEFARHNSWLQFLQTYL